jgi:hypothetical protein
VNGNDGDRQDGKTEDRPPPMLLDMGLGSREQGFCKQAITSKPKLKLVHSSDHAPA